MLCYVWERPAGSLTGPSRRQVRKKATTRHGSWAPASAHPPRQRFACVLQFGFPPHSKTFRSVYSAHLSIRRAGAPLLLLRARSCQLLFVLPMWRMFAARTGGPRALARSRRRARAAATSRVTGPVLAASSTSEMHCRSQWSRSGLSECIHVAVVGHHLMPV